MDRIIPHFKVLPIKHPVKHMEYVGKVCYGSKMTPTVEEGWKFVQKLIKLGHISVLEHWWENWEFEQPVELDTHGKTHYVDPWNWRRRVHPHDQPNMWVGMRNLRTLDNVQLNHEYDKHWNQPADFSQIPIDHPHMRWASVEVVCSRACSQQWQRHRWPWSYMERSLRHCEPEGYIMPKLDTFNDSVMTNAIESSVETYRKLRDNGAKKEDARSVLPMCTATRFIATAPLNGWNHFFAMRAVEEKGNHPQGEIKVLAREIQAAFERKFGRLIKPYKMTHWVSI